jgi:hypothetical protein
LPHAPSQVEAEGVIKKGAEKVGFKPALKHVIKEISIYKPNEPACLASTWLLSTVQALCCNVNMVDDGENTLPCGHVL